MLDLGYNPPKGVDIELLDQTRRYFGDFHHLRIALTLRFSLAELTDLTLDEKDFVADSSSISLVRTLEKMGVPSGNVNEEKRELIRHFYTTALPYLARPEFVLALLRARLKSPRSRRCTL